MPFLSDLFTGPHLIIVLVLVVVLFGAAKLPIFAKGLGQSIKIFRKEIHDVSSDIKDERKQAAANQAAEPVIVTVEPPAGFDAAPASAATPSAPGASTR